MTAPMANDKHQCSSKMRWP